MNNIPSITAVKIKRVANPITSVIATATITIEDCLAIHNIKLLKDNKGRRRLAFPSTKKEQNGLVLFSDLVHPTNSEFRNYIEELVFNLYDTGEENC